MKSVLIVDDEVGARESLKMILKNDYEVFLAKNAEESFAQIKKHSPDVVLLDIILPDLDGLKVLEKIKQSDPDVIVIMITATKTVKTAVEAMKLGAYDYVTKPFDIDELRLLVSRSLSRKALEQEVKFRREEMDKNFDFGQIIGKSKPMKDIFRVVNQIADSRSTVLIMGESGTGKELVSRAVHYNSNRKNYPFVTINCAAIPETLIESELFGHEKGAFTGAVARKIGKFEAAAGGTIFLDEIGDMNMPLQGKLLRVLQEREFERVGGTEPIKTDVRVIAATHRNLEKAVREKRFREDLFYRLNVIQINIPPLRKRKDDITPLAEYFMQKYQPGPGKTKILTPETLKILRAYDWPGNVRELENAVQRAITLAQGDKIFPDALPPQIFKPGHGIALSFENFLEEKLVDLVERMGGLETGDIYSMVLQRVEKPLITLVLRKTEGNQVRAAHLLGINRNTLRKKIKELGIKGPFNGEGEEEPEEEE